MGLAITCMAVSTQDLTIFCGLKSGDVMVQDQNILARAVLRGHSREVTSLAVSDDMLVSLARDHKVITWSVKHRVGSGYLLLHLLHLLHLFLHLIHLPHRRLVIK